MLLEIQENDYLQFLDSWVIPFLNLSISLLTISVFCCFLVSHAVRRLELKVKFGSLTPSNSCFTESTSSRSSTKSAIKSPYGKTTSSFHFIFVDTLGFMLRSFLKWFLLEAEQRLTRTNSRFWLHVVLHAVVSARFVTEIVQIAPIFSAWQKRRFVFMYNKGFLFEMRSDVIGT